MCKTISCLTRAYSWKIEIPTRSFLPEKDIFITHRTCRRPHTILILRGKASHSSSAANQMRGRIRVALRTFPRLHTKSKSPKVNSCHFIQPRRHDESLLRFARSSAPRMCTNERGSGAISGDSRPLHQVVRTHRSRSH
jgi:hypothetical protein